MHSVLWLLSVAILWNNYINYSKSHIHLIHTNLVQFMTGGCEGIFWGLRVEQPPIVNKEYAQ